MKRRRSEYTKKGVAGMSVMDKLINAMKINGDPYDDEPDDDY